MWVTHFNELSAPKDKDAYEKDHFEYVNKFVNKKARNSEEDQFLFIPFTPNDIKEAFKRLHKKKTAGFDAITTEHLHYAEDSVIY